MEVEVLMKRMVELQQQQEEEECSQEEMVTRFERERSESIPTGADTCHHCRLGHFKRGTNFVVNSDFYCGRAKTIFLLLIF